MRIGIVSILLGLLGVIGCDETPCDACTSCSNWVGTYAGELKGIVGSTCGEPSSLDTPIRIRIYSVRQQPQTGEAELTEIELEMENGDRWTEFKGTVCESQESEQPFSYAFRAEYRGEESVDDKTLSIHNTITGLLASAAPDQDDASDRISARYTANRVTHRVGASSEFCQMLGTIEVYRR